jgi:DNA-binding response OmpR family regulator
VGRYAVARILIADDDANMLLLMEYHLAKQGYDVATAGDGVTALRTAAEQPFDLFLLDVMLPGMSGLELCRQLRADARYAHTPIVLVTARGQMGDWDAAAQYGANSYVTKPFDPMLLVDLVNGQLAARTESGE